ncbi:MAG: hypothetical protein HZB19_09325 [Chloroflexi bacterium]|nr:hypothetical protein [Chloroflexota bacterium]
MKKYSVFLAILALVIASLACQAITGGGDVDAPEIPDIDSGGDNPTQPTAVPDSGGDGFNFGGDSQFVMPPDATNVINMGTDTTIFTTNLKQDEVMNFYRDELGKQGLTERDLLTVTSDTTFSMVFDGHSSGKAVVVQGVDMGDGTTTVTITLQDV